MNKPEIDNFDQSVSFPMDKEYFENPANISVPSNGPAMQIVCSWLNGQQPSAF